MRALDPPHEQRLPFARLSTRESSSMQQSTQPLYTEEKRVAHAAHWRDHSLDAAFVRHSNVVVHVPDVAVRGQIRSRPLLITAL